MTDEQSPPEEDEPQTLAFDDGWRLEVPEADSDSDDDWGGNDLEAAYRRALEANDAVEWGFDHDEAAAEPVATENTASDEVDASNSAPESEAPPPEPEAQPVPDPVPARVTAKQVIEAALFVGGEPLTTKKLCYLLRGDYEMDAVESAIAELNLLYQAEERPYEIRLGEGGYRLAVRYEYEQVRNRVFGIGPREVKLSQDVLEVLALVAYRQPISPEEIEALGKSNPAPMLRQLLRRELVSLQRDADNRKLVKYSTTRRFLSVFGLGNIDELPQADELDFK
jgi:segregation and condensation protein B